MRRTGPIVFALLGLLAGSALQAHDFWIEPSGFRPEPGSRVAVRLRVGERLQGEPVPRMPGRIERFAAVGPGGEMEIVGMPGADPAGWASPTSPGLHWIVYDSNHARAELDDPEFDAYLGEEGLEAVRGQRAGKPGMVKEIYSRCAKSLLAVGEGHEAMPGFDRVLGLELELVPEKSPYALKPGETLPVRLLYRGKPLAGALIVAISKASPDAKVAVRSDASGRAGLRLDHPGLWLVKAVHMIPAPAGSAADWESFWASLTFER